MYRPPPLKKKNQQFNLISLIQLPINIAGKVGLYKLGKMPFIVYLQ